jgi:hypothetical protein
MAKLSSAELKLYIWSGDILKRPSTPTYTITKTKLVYQTTIVFEIAELVKDYVEVEFDGNYRNIKQTKNVEWEITRTYDDDTTDSDSEKIKQKAIAFRGYGQLNDNINPELSKDFMISNSVINNLCGSEIIVPFYQQGTDGVTKVVYFQDTTQLKLNTTGSAVPFTIAQEVRLNPPVDIKIDKTASLSSSSNKSVNTSSIPVNANKVTITRADGTTRTINIQCIDECKNLPHKLSFLNKFGVIQSMYFFALKRDGINTNRTDYKKSIIQIETNPTTYNPSLHQTRYIENQGRERFTMNTGFIHPSHNQVIKEILVSEYVYIHDTNRLSPSDQTSALAVPVKVVSDNVNFLTRKDDKLINYALEFEADSEFVQSIR